MEAAVKEEPFLQRLRNELEELSARYEKLDAFTTSPPFYQLDEAERKDLREQYVLMRQYGEILKRRIQRIQSKH